MDKTTEEKSRRYSMAATIDDTPLQRMRVARGLSQTEFGQEFGLHQTYISRLERVHLPFPCPPELAERFAEFFGTAWCGPERELLFLYPDRYRGVPLPFERPFDCVPTR